MNRETKKKLLFKSRRRPRFLRPTRNADEGCDPDFSNSFFVTTTSENGFNMVQLPVSKEFLVGGAKTLAGTVAASIVNAAGSAVTVTTGAIPSLTPACQAIGMAPLGGGTDDVLAAGGDDNDAGLMAKAWIYTRASNTWAAVAAMPAAKSETSGAPTVMHYLSATGLPYILGGCAVSGTPVGTMYSYNRGLDSWSTMAPMTARQRFASMVLDNGTLFVSGGTSQTTQIYNANTDSWTSGAAPPISFVTHFGQTVKLSDGRVCIVQATDNTILIYTPGTDSWSVSATAPGTLWRSGGSAVALGDDTVLVFGTGGTFHYDPSDNTWDDLSADFVPSTHTKSINIDGSSCSFLLAVSNAAKLVTG